MMPVLGSNPRVRVGARQTLLHNAGMAQGRILLVTDGVDRIVDVSMEASPNFPISILGVGTAAGAPIPLDFVDRPGRSLTDRQGNTIIAKLDDRRARRRSRRCATGATHGRGRRRQSDAAARHATAERRRPASPRGQVRSVGRLGLLAGAAAGAVGAAQLPARRRRIAALRAAAAAGARELVGRPVANDGSAGIQRVAARRPGTRRDAVRESAMARRGAVIAAATSAAPTNISRPMRRRPETTTAATRFAHEGKFDEAIAAYDETLRAKPDDADAAFNKALLEKLLQTSSNRGATTTRNRSAIATKRKSDQSREQNSAGNPNQDESQGRSQRTGQQATRDEAAEVGAGSSRTRSDDGETADGRTRSTARRKTRRARAMVAARAGRPFRPAAAQIPVRDAPTLAQRRARPPRPGADLVRARAARSRHACFASPSRSRGSNRASTQRPSPRPTRFASRCAPTARISCRVPTSIRSRRSSKFSATQRSAQFRSINGQVDASTTWTLLLKPKHTGAVEIPALSLGGETTRPIQITVKELDPQLDARSRRRCSSRPRYEPKQVYVQSQVVVTRKLFYVNGAQLYGDMPNVPEVPGAMVRPLGESEHSTAVRDGRQYGVIEQRFAVFPEHSGELMIPPATVTGSVRADSGMGAPHRRRRQSPTR